MNAFAEFPQASAICLRTFPQDPPTATFQLRPFIMQNFCGRTRREMLWQTGAGFTGVALASMLSKDGFLNSQTVAAYGEREWENPLAPKPPHFAPRAKNVIFFYCYGGPSHIDTFDYKPDMYGMDGKTIDVKTFGRGGHKNKGRIVEPRWKFKQYGECGKWVLSLIHI